MGLLGNVKKEIGKGGKYVIIKLLGIMKAGKAPGIYDIPNKVWKYGRKD